MPVSQVQVRCQLENVTNLQAPGDDFQYCIKTKCGSCGEVSEKWQYVAVDEVVAVPHSRGSCNMLVKCKLCGRTNTLDVLADKKKTYTMEDVPSFKVIIAFECRGLSVVDFQFGKGWQCQGVDSRTPFTDLDLDEEWCDYDEEANLPVGITELEYKVT
ncbi:CXXC motif containing zinc binding protein-like isoform X1 [Eriocheir sinensis]|uniref:CXXC motif containing zinc binding protein-like isoform X1 n=1 Tax=Eriocheir sinensis TaxID=95602 RepID=UPI0021C75146|nr:CXXC motif containing zinc binding protein-like isoform X1 [Eriocheir sinensis]